MADYNKHIKETKYTYNYGIEEFLIIISGICIVVMSILILPYVMDWLEGIVYKYGWGTIIAVLVVGGFGLMVFVYITMLAFWKIKDCWERSWLAWWLGYGPEWGRHSYNSKNNTLSVKEDKPLFDRSKVYTESKPVKYGRNRTVLLDGEREKAPRAEFFGRINGKPLVRQGKYEEGWLNNFELEHWKKQKERKEAQKDGLLDENPKPRIQTW